jgi:hypothetical protein
MATICRAKDPTKCKVHGLGGSVQQLELDKAKAIRKGDFKSQFEIQRKIDSLSDTDPNAEQNPKASFFGKLGGKLFRKNSGETVVDTPRLPEPTPEDFVLTDEQKIVFDNMESDSNGFVRLGDITRGMLGEQTQYISRHFDGVTPSSPVLVDELRIDISSTSYHEYKIHKEDVIPFVARLRAYRRSTSRSCR